MKKWWDKVNWRFTRIERKESEDVRNGDSGFCKGKEYTGLCE